MSVVPKNKKITEAQIEALALKYQVEVPSVKAFAEVEGSGIGYSDTTGRILIQFEPHLMKRYIAGTKAPLGDWVNNGISNQTIEYKALESAMKTDKLSAMKATSIGMMQVLGVHYRLLGFSTCQAMWDFADISEANQLELGLMFVRANPALYKALKLRDWHLVAYYYNGTGYKALAEKHKTTPYNIRLARAYAKFAAMSTTHKTTTTVNIRTGAGTAFGLASTPLRVGTAVNRLDTLNGWTRVEVVATGQTGWVSSQYIT